MVRGGGISLLGERGEGRREKEISCQTDERARQTGHRRLSPSGGEEARVLCAYAARRRQPGTAPAQRFAAATRTGRGAAARRNPGAGAGDHSASGDGGGEFDVRERSARGARCGG